jgi:peptidoglycan/LPS O-acetylase OafA/YrhL
MNFRKDINGLRALAVIAVVLYHFNETWISGGFAGVDVFFVISGFLMTGIIVRGMEKNNFSSISFYLARANRLVPALALLCAVVLVFGWFYLTPLDYSTLGKHASSSIQFTSNLAYWKESGYFDAVSREKWLLHTWSLSVEWQFYIIYPLLLVFMKKFMSMKSLKISLLVLTLLSFIICLVTVSGAYYKLPTREWEMLVGAIAYLYPLTLGEKNKKWVAYTGFGLILSSFFLISKNNLWPGYLALIPVLGTFLVIQAQNSKSVLTDNIVCQKLGTWSYSIYLWHWPIVVAIYTFELTALSSLIVYAGIVLSILIGFLSYTYVEKIKFTMSFNRFWQYFSYKPLYLIVCIMLVGNFIHKNEGFVSRFDHIPQLEQLISKRAEAENYYMKHLMAAFTNQGEAFDDSFLCALDGRKQTLTSVVSCLDYKLGDGGYLVIGDSHGRDFLHALFMSYPQTHFSMLQHAGCVPSSYKNKRRCFPLLNEINDTFIRGNKKIKGIIFASLYGDDLGIDSFIDDINRDSYGDIPIYVINTNPRIKSIVDISIKQSKVSDYYSVNIADNLKAVEINNKLTRLKQVTYFDKYAVFCEGLVCKLNDGINPYFWDSGHLSWLGIQKLSAAITAQELLNR